MSGLVTALYQIAALGLVSGGLLALGGGPKEILRLGCACVMVVAVLTAIQKTPPTLPDLRRYEQAVQPQVEQAQQAQRNTLLEQTETELAAWLEQQAENLQLECHFTVTCFADRSHSVTVQQVDGVYYSGPREHLLRLREIIREQLAVTDGQILIQEASI